MNRRLGQTHPAGDFGFGGRLQDGGLDDFLLLCGEQGEKLSEEKELFRLSGGVRRSGNGLQPFHRFGLRLPAHAFIEDQKFVFLLSGPLLD
ncbi:MAG: hypothetical protein PWP43_593 [Bacillota bacterium]|nr:hypothetical protein [Bacillota bacterium]